mgnify:FL=1
MMTIAIADFEKLVKNSTKWDSTVKYLEIITDPASTSYEQIQSTIAGLRSASTDARNKLTEALAELTNKDDQVSRLKNQVADEQKLRIELTSKLNQAVTKYADISGVYEGQIKDLQGQIDTRSKEIGTLKIELAKCQGTEKSVPSKEIANIIQTIFRTLRKWLAKNGK